MRRIMLAALIGAAATGASAQPAGVTRADVLRADLSAPGREVVQARVTIPPGVTAPRHSHPGEEVAYVLEGTLEYRLDGRPPVTLTAGQALFIPAGAVHAAENVSRRDAVELATYVVEKGKPLATPAR